MTPHPTCPQCMVRERVHDAPLCHVCRDVALGYASTDFMGLDDRPADVRITPEPGPVEAAIRAEEREAQ